MCVSSRLASFFKSQHCRLTRGIVNPMMVSRSIAQAGKLAAQSGISYRCTRLAAYPHPGDNSPPHFSLRLSIPKAAGTKQEHISIDNAAMRWSQINVLRQGYDNWKAAIHLTPPPLLPSKTVSPEFRLFNNPLKHCRGISFFWLIISASQGEKPRTSNKSRTNIDFIRHTGDWRVINLNRSLVFFPCFLIRVNGNLNRRPGETIIIILSKIALSTERAQRVTMRVIYRSQQAPSRTTIPAIIVDIEQCQRGLNLICPDYASPNPL